MHLLDPVGHQLLELGNNDRCDTFDQFFHFVEALLGLIEILFLEFSNQVTKNVVFLVMKSHKHLHLVNVDRQYFFQLLFVKLRLDTLRNRRLSNGLLLII